MDETQQRGHSNLEHLQDVKPKREELFKAEFQASIERIILFNDSYSVLLIRDKWLRLSHGRIWSCSSFSARALWKYSSSTA